MIKTQVVNSQTLNILSGITLLNDLSYIRVLLREFHSDYPNIDQWFISKVYSGIISGNRTILIKKKNNRILGLSILKHTAVERKLCTLYVDKKIQGKGVGTELLEESLGMLQYSHPIFTVSSKRIYEFQSLLRKFDFNLYAVYPDYYKKGLTEYVFNGYLTSNNKKFSSNKRVHLTAIPLRPSALLHSGK